MCFLYGTADLVLVQVDILILQVNIRIFTYIPILVRGRRGALRGFPPQKGEAQAGDRRVRFGIESEGQAARRAGGVARGYGVWPGAGRSRGEGLPPPKKKRRGRSSIAGPAIF